MAGRQQNIGGLAISLVADASQLKSTFEEALRAYTNRKVKVTLTAEVDETFKKAIEHLRTQKVDLNLVFSPRRDVLRQLKRDIQAGIEAEGGIKVPISARSFTKAQGQTIADEVRAAVGPVDVEMVVNWRWGENGPPPDWVTRGGGGGTPGGGGGFFFGRVQSSTVERGPTQAVVGAHQVERPAAPPPEQPAPATPPPVEEPEERKPRKGTFLSRREGEDDEAYAARLTQRLGDLEGRLQSASERTRARANNEMARIEKILGLEQRHARVPVPEKGRLPGDQTTYPERISATGERVRGPASVGPLPTGGPTDWEKVARLFFDNYAKREKPDALIEGRERELQGLRAERTRMEGALRFPKRSPLYRDVVAEISAKERELAEIQGPRGFRGQRASTSFFSEGIAPVRANSERAALVAAGKEPSSMDEFIQVLKDSPGKFSSAFNEGLKLVGQGKLGEALTTTRAALQDLLARGRGGKIPGVARGTVARVLDPTKDLLRRPDNPERERAEAGFAFEVETLQDLIGAIGTVQRDITLTQKAKRPRRRKSVGTDAPLAPPTVEEVAEIQHRAEERFPTKPIDIAQQTAEDQRLMALDRDMTGRSYLEQLSGQGLLHQKVLSDEAAKHGLSRDELADMAEAAGMSSEDLIDAIEEMASPLMRQLERAQNAGFRGSEIGLNEEARRRAGEPPESARAEGGGIDMRHPDYLAWQKRLHAAREDYVRELEGAGGNVPPPVPPGTVNFGGGGQPPDEGGFFAFGGGPLPVSVVNWPASFESGGIAAGTTKLSGDQEFFSGMKAAFGESLHEFLERGGAPKGEPRAAKTAKEKEAAEAIRHQRATGFSTAIGQAQLRGIAPSPEEQQQVEEEAERAIRARIGDQLERTRGAQRFAQEAVELSPARAVATAAGQVAANLPFFGGRSSILERKRRADEAEAAEKKSLRGLVDQQKALGELERQQQKVKPDSKAYKQLTDQIGQQKVAVDRAEASWRKHAVAAEDAAKNVAGARDIMRSFGAGVVGTIAGQILFQAALGGTQVVVGALTEAIGPAIERTLGYQNATNALVKSIGEQTRALRGQEEVAVAQVAAQSNLSEAQYEGVRAALELRASRQSANQVYEEQIRLLAAAANIERENREFRVAQPATAEQARRFGERGLLEQGLPPGVDRSLLTTTGGANILGIQTPFGGQKPFEELLREQLGQIPESPAAVTGSEFLGSVFSSPKYLEERTEILGRTLEDINRQFEGTGVRFVEATDAMAASAEESTEALRAAGIQVRPDQLQRQGIALTQEAAGLSQRDFLEAMVQAQRQRERPDPAVLLAAAEPQLKATFFGIQQGLKNTLETFIPAQRGLQFAAQPVPRFGTSFAPPAVTGLEVESGRTEFAGVPAQVTATFDQYRTEAQEAIDAVNAKAMEGRRVLTEQLGVPESVLAELSGMGERIEGINRQQRAIQLDVQYSQFNRQLFIANRTLGDLAGLTGRAGSTQVGLLQREQLLLSRRSQALQLQGQLLNLQTGELQQQSSELGHQQNLLQLELQQRQINFQRAVAGFTAPGVTPEERAARIDEAKIEADFAQRQLDFQREQSKIQREQLTINREQLILQERGFALAEASFANQIALQDELNERAYQDQLAAIAELKKAFDASLQLSALEELKGLLTAQRDLLLEEIQAQVQAEEEFIKAQAQFTQDLLAQTGEFVVTTVGKVQTVFTRTARAFEQSGLGRFLGGGGSAPVEDYTGGNINPTGIGPKQTGFLGNVGAPGGVRMTVGEAGIETVAILRNPRQAFVGVGGAGVSNVIQVTVTGNHISGESDERRLAERIAVEVEQIIGRRASNQGFRFSAR